jgi:hypothetical protein
MENYTIGAKYVGLTSVSYQSKFKMDIIIFIIIIIIIIITFIIASNFF